jgi:DNA-binding transcriptional regulator/RsmH inhibitor MraZ
MALLREIGMEAEATPWRHWIVALEQIGRVSLPPGARQILGAGVPVRAVSRDHMLVLHCGGVGASLPIDGRGRLVLPAWFRSSVRSSRSVLVAARSPAPASVVLAPTGLLDDLVSHVAGEVE